MAHTFQKQSSPFCSYLWNFLILFPSKFSSLWKLVKFSKKGRKTGKRLHIFQKLIEKSIFLGKKSRFPVRFQKAVSCVEFLLLRVTISFLSLKITKIWLQIVFQRFLLTLHCVSMRFETFGMLEKHFLGILKQILSKNS